MLGAPSAKIDSKFSRREDVFLFILAFDFPFVCLRDSVDERVVELFRKVFIQAVCRGVSNNLFQKYDHLNRQMQSTPTSHSISNHIRGSILTQSTERHVAF
jgi:hypothetical protein